MTREPDYSWRIKLGGPEEEDPLNMPGKVLNLYDRSRPLSPRLAVKDEAVEELLEKEVEEGEHDRFSGTASQIVSQNQSGLLDQTEVNFKDDSRMMHHFRVAGNATNLSKDNSDNWFHPHNVDTSSEHLSLSQISDMWLQYTDSGLSAVDPREWRDRQVSVFLDPEYAQRQASRGRGSINQSALNLTYGDILREEERPEKAVNTFEESLLPTEFSIAEREIELEEEYENFGPPTEIIAEAGEETVRLKLQQDLEEILEEGYVRPVEYRSENVDTVHEHLGLAGLSEKWFEICSLMDRRETY